MGEFTSAYEWEGRTVLDRDGEKLGTLESVYLEHGLDTPVWALVNTGLFGTKSSFVPLVDASPRGEDVEVTVTQDQVKDAPKLDAGEELSPQDEADLYRHYGLDYASVQSRITDTAVDVSSQGLLSRREGP